MVFWILLGLFAVIRLVPLFSDLWLDEIWSVVLVRQLNSPAEILTRYLVDNNHPLNSLWIYAVGVTSADWVYRLLSWSAGVAAVWLASEVARLQWRQLHPDAAAAESDAARLITAALFGGSYLFVFYSSEARGYSAAVACGLLAICALWRGAHAPDRRWVPVYWAACVAGLAAHAIMVQVIMAGVAYSLLRALPSSKRVASIGRWHAVPVGAAVIYYLGFVRRLLVGGGPQLSLTRVLGEMSAYMLGVPVGAALVVALPLVIGAAGVALWQIARRDRSLLAFYLTLFSVAALAPFGRQFDVVYPRYFIVVAAAVLLLVGHGLTRLFASGSVRRFVACAVVGLCLLGDSAYLAQLFRHGRGEYRAALRYIGAHTASTTIALASDQDARNGAVVHYFAPLALPGRTVHYVTASAALVEHPPWLLVHRFDGEPAPAAEVRGAQGDTYALAARFGHAPLSGWDWYVFRNTQFPPDAPATR